MQEKIPVESLILLEGRQKQIEILQVYCVHPCQTYQTCTESSFVINVVVKYSICPKFCCTVLNVHNSC